MISFILSTLSATSANTVAALRPLDTSLRVFQALSPAALGCVPSPLSSALFENIVLLSHAGLRLPANDDGLKTNGLLIDCRIRRVGLITTETACVSAGGRSWRPSLLYINVTRR